MSTRKKKDPTQTSVQFNMTMSWQLREDIATIGNRRGESAAEVVRGAISSTLRKDLHDLAQERAMRDTQMHGATS